MENLLQLTDFSALLQLCATFFVAFVAFEYARSYTSILAKNLFGFQTMIDSKKNGYTIVKEVLLSEFSDERFQSGSALRFLETAKKDIDKMNEDIESLNETLAKMVNDKCSFDAFRFISIHVFVYCLSLLYVAGLATEALHTFVFNFTLTSFCCTAVFTLLYFCLGFSHRLTGRRYNTVNNMVTLVYTATSLLASFTAGRWFVLIDVNCTADNWNVLMVLSTLLPIIVLLVGIIYVSIVGFGIYRTITDSYQPIKLEKARIEKNVENWKIRDQVEQQYGDVADSASQLEADGGKDVTDVEE